MSIAFHKPTFHYFYSPYANNHWNKPKQTARKERAWWYENR
jgi:hypothetical protein